MTEDVTITGSQDKARMRALVLFWGAMLLVLLLSLCLHPRREICLHVAMKNVHSLLATEMKGNGGVWPDDPMKLIEDAGIAGRIPPTYHLSFTRYDNAWPNVAYMWTRQPWLVINEYMQASGNNKMHELMPDGSINTYESKPVRLDQASAASENPSK